MENKTIAHLQAEVAQLNQLIKVLMVENIEIKSEIAYIKTYIGNTEPKIAHPNVYVGNTEAEIAHPKTYVGNSEANVAHPNIYMGNTEVNVAHPKTYMGNTEDSVAHPKTGVGNLSNSTPLPEIITEQLGIKSKLKHFLNSQNVAGNNRKAIDATAELIIHIYNKKPCSYTELRKATGLSKFGLAKRLRALKKAAIIVNNGYQKFSLTNKTLQMIQQAVNK